MKENLELINILSKGVDQHLKQHEIIPRSLY